MFGQIGLFEAHGGTVSSCRKLLLLPALLVVSLWGAMGVVCFQPPWHVDACKSRRYQGSFGRSEVAILLV